MAADKHLGLEWRAQQHRTRKQRSNVKMSEKYTQPRDGMNRRQVMAKIRHLSQRVRTELVDLTTEIANLYILHQQLTAATSAK